VAFALENSSKNGLFTDMNTSDFAQFKNDVKTVQSRGQKVLISSGGATGPYPWDSSLADAVIAGQYTSFMREFGYDGISFDVEGGTGSNIPAIAKLIKQQVPSAIISVTCEIGSTGILRSNVESLVKQMYQDGTLSFFEGQDYNFGTWKPPYGDFTSTSIQLTPYNVYGAIEYHYDNLFADYADSTTKMMARDFATSQDQARRYLVVGLMIGKMDAGPDITLDVYKGVVSWVKTSGFGGVMTWALNRDQDGSGVTSYSTGLTGNGPGAYTNATISIMGGK
jgi:chitinase